jgi:prolyl 4-hydroxylase
MSITVKLSSELKAWVTHNLDRGCRPDALIQSMIAEKFEPAVARGIVDVFVRVRTTGTPLAGDTLILETAQPPYTHEPSRLPPGGMLRTADRAVPVLMRVQRPAIAVLANVLSTEECEQLIALARPRLTPSTVVDPSTGANRVAEHRNSEGMFFRLGETPFIAALDRRLSQIMNAPMEHGEGLQVLRYGPGTRSTPHFDFLVPSNATNRQSLARSGQRVSSLVVYLNEVPQGGETAFPEAGVSVSPHPGHAVYFEYCNSRGELDPLSLHAGAPVIEGEKWAVTKWMRERRFVSA